MKTKDLLDKALNFIVETERGNDSICGQMCNVDDYCENNCQNLNKECVKRFLEKVYNNDCLPIQEDYISFETAKLLKEKGFDGKCRSRYGTSGSFSYEKYEIDASECEINNAILAPTLQMAMKWLRNKHHLYIQVWILSGQGYWYDIEKIIDCSLNHKSIYSTGLIDLYYQTPEQASEAAIKYCLENLI